MSAPVVLRELRENPLQFVRQCFGVEPDEWQRDALVQLGGPVPQPRRRLAMKACTGPGKSAVLAWICWHRLACFGRVGEHPKGAALSGEGRDNLKDNLWAEIDKWRHRSPFLMAQFEWTKERAYNREHEGTWFCSARSYPKDANAEQLGSALSGLHSEYPFLLLDEIGKMPPAVGQKATQIFTGGVVDGLLAAAGNPVSTAGLLYDIWQRHRDMWICITITADPDDPKRTPRVDIEHARQMIAKYGRDNPWVMSTILGQFPPSSLNALLGIEEVDAAMNRHLTEDKYSFVQKRIGVDVARFGDDRTIIAPRQGLAGFRFVEMRNADTFAIAARVMAAKDKWGAENLFVDGTGGYGAGVIDALRNAGEPTNEVQFSGKAIDDRYFNKRSEIWFEMAKWVKRGAVLPKDPQLARELTEPLYYFQDGKLRLEEKDQIKKRLGFSPDIADAYATTFAFPDQPARLTIPGADRNGRPVYVEGMYADGSVGRGKMVSEWDPTRSS